MTDNPGSTEKPDRELYQELYQAGVRSFERGNYQQAIAQFQQALDGVNAKTKIGGEIQVWLANAYDAAGNSTEAIALCRSLKTHSDRDVRKSANYVLGILSAPKLSNLKDATSKIPSLKGLDDQISSRPLGVSGSKLPQAKPENQLPTGSSLDTQTSQQEQNRFLWIAIVITLAGLVVWAIA
ncbi:tetratricopeptide repeat protein [Pseudanabaena sp. PCC 6802]|uniref:tetratricopeptide repeat protein n=1 Tax=Pseudanabaena sp. PCC 6802 TaxID=118173 RepID=UPI00034AB912|nr:tetratricopeptide repeat protein [Pseudanabaena sp. PCC 6802]